MDPRVLCSTPKSKQQHQVTKQLWHTFEYRSALPDPPVAAISIRSAKRANEPENAPVDPVTSSQPMKHLRCYSESPL